MNNGAGGFQVLEILIILGIVTWQLYVAGKTFRRIAFFLNIFPGSKVFVVQEFFVEKTNLESLSADELLSNFNQYFSQEIDDASESRYTSVTLVIKTKPGNSVTNSIINSLNTYLIRNKGAVSDFHLLKDVVERNFDLAEREIVQRTSIPLYMGLMGTFIGILFGVGHIATADLTKSDELNNAVTSLMYGVAIAMVASFCGLLLTTLVNNKYLREAQAVVQARKNEFYSFLQTSLLPILNQNINSTLASMSMSLHKFNEQFNVNVKDLNNAMGKNHESLSMQADLLKTVQSIDPVKYATANVKILTALDNSVQKLEQFNQFIGTLGETLAQSNRLVNNTNLLVHRMGGVEAIASDIKSIFVQNDKLTQFLGSHFNSLDESRQQIGKAVNLVGNTLSESLDNLKNITQAQIHAIQVITSEEVNKIRDQDPSKWDKLDNLSFLKRLTEVVEVMGRDIGEMKVNNASQMVKLNKEMASLSKSLQDAKNSQSRVVILLQQLWSKVKTTFDFNRR